MMGAVMNKVPEFPRAHEFQYNYAIPIESAAAKNSTIMPIVCYDEGLGVINSFKTNPQNASFVESASANCYPTSRVNKFFARLDVSMSKIMLQTDKVPAIRFATMGIHTSFMDGQLAEDEVSGLDLNEILELENESTDRQTTPLYNTISMATYKSNPGLDMPADQAGLDTDLEIEAVAFSLDDYYDCLHYYTNGKKLRSITTGLQWHTLTAHKPYTSIFFNQDSQTKYLNPYTLNAALIHVPFNNATDQLGKASDTTIETCTLECTFHVRYNEFNHEMNHGLQ